MIIYIYIYNIHIKKYYLIIGAEANPLNHFPCRRTLMNLAMMVWRQLSKLIWGLQLVVPVLGKGGVPKRTPIPSMLPRNPPRPRQSRSRPWKQKPVWRPWNPSHASPRARLPKGSLVHRRSQPLMTRLMTSLSQMARGLDQVAVLDVAGAGLQH